MAKKKQTYNEECACIACEAYDRTKLLIEEIFKEYGEHAAQNSARTIIQCSQEFLKFVNEPTYH